MSTFEQLRSTLTQAGYNLLENEPMYRHTSFKVGGPAELFVQATSEAQLAELLRQCNALGISPTVIGRGSNLLVADAGIPGLVLCVGEGLSQIERAGETQITCQAGASLMSLCRFALEHSLTGLEFAYGIPGSLGGAVYMNAGAYGGEISSVVHSVTHLNPDGSSGSLQGQALGFCYRHSAYEGSGCIITSAVLQLHPGNKEEIRKCMEETLQKRKDKQPLEYPSAGSTFKRPPGGYASAMVDACGLKGLRIGGAMVSEKHAGFLINYDNATATDILALIEEVRRRVQAQTGCLLECEVKLLGKGLGAD